MRIEDRAFSVSQHSQIQRCCELLRLHSTNQTKHVLHRNIIITKNKLRGLSPRANYTDQSTAACCAKLVPTSMDRGCHVVSVTDLYGSILGFLDRNRYFFFQVAPQLYSRGWMDPVPDPLLLRKSGSVGNRTRTSWSVTRYSDHKTTETVIIIAIIILLVFNMFIFTKEPYLTRLWFSSLAIYNKSRW
jgi:hypothetical protein